MNKKCSCTKLLLLLRGIQVLVLRNEMGGGGLTDQLRLALQR